MPHIIQQNAALSPAAVPDAQQCQKKTNSLSPARASTLQNALIQNSGCCEAVIFHCYQLLLKNWKTYLNGSSVFEIFSSIHKIPLAHKLPFPFSSQNEIFVLPNVNGLFSEVSDTYLQYIYIYFFHFTVEKKAYPYISETHAGVHRTVLNSVPPYRLINILNYTFKEKLERSIRGHGTYSNMNMGQTILLLLKHPCAQGWGHMLALLALLSDPMGKWHAWGKDLSMYQRQYWTGWRKRVTGSGRQFWKVEHLFGSKTLKSPIDVPDLAKKIHA